MAQNLLLAIIERSLKDVLEFITTGKVYYTKTHAKTAMEALEFLFSDECKCFCDDCGLKYKFVTDLTIEILKGNYGSRRDKKRKTLPNLSTLSKIKQGRATSR